MRQHDALTTTSIVFLLRMSKNLKAFAPLCLGSVSSDEIFSWRQAVACFFWLHKAGVLLFVCKLSYQAFVFGVHFGLLAPRLGWSGISSIRSVEALLSVVALQDQTFGRQWASTLKSNSFLKTSGSALEASLQFVNAHMTDGSFFHARD
jgi:hypothetical protein